MRRRRRTMLAVALGALGFGALAAPAAQGAVPGSSCVISGYTPDAGVDAEQLRSLARNWHAQEVRGGEPLASGGVWEIPDGSEPVLLVQSTQPLTHGHAELSVLGWRLPLTEGKGHARLSYVSTATTPLLGHWTRRVGVYADGGPCRGSLVISVSRPAYSTVLGGGGLAMLAIGVLGTVVLARRRRAGWLSAALSAAPFALMAGAGETLLLHETGLLSPFSTLAWWIPLGVLPLAVLMPLTRSPRRVTPSPQGEQLGEPAGAVTAPTRGLPTAAHRLIGAALVLILGAGAAGIPLAVSPSAAAANTETVTPTQARIVFESLWNDGRSVPPVRYTLNPVYDFRTDLFRRYPAFKNRPATDVAVGVPAGQDAYPAFFVATARTELSDSRSLFFYVLVERESDTAPWQVADLRAALEARAVPRPKTLPDGHLAPLPAVSRLAIDPATVSHRYATWFNRSTRGSGLVGDAALTLAPGSGPGALRMTNTRGLRWASAWAGRKAKNGHATYRTFAAQSAAAIPEQVPLADGSVLVSFATTVQEERYNNDRPSTRPCSVMWLYIPDEPAEHYRHMSGEISLRPVAYIHPRTARQPTLVDDAGPWTAWYRNTPC